MLKIRINTSFPTKKLKFPGEMSSNSKTNFFKGGATRSNLASNISPTPERTSPTPSGDSDPKPGVVLDDKTIFEEIRKVSATLQVVVTDVVSIKETMKELMDAVESIQVRLGEAEQRIADVEDVYINGGKHGQVWQATGNTVDAHGISGKPQQEK